MAARSKPEAKLRLYIGGKVKARLDLPPLFPEDWCLEHRRGDA